MLSPEHPCRRMRFSRKPPSDYVGRKSRKTGYETTGVDKSIDLGYNSNMAKICGYCGREKDGTIPFNKEHVIPACIYHQDLFEENKELPKWLPEEFHKKSLLIHTCDPCNTEKSKYDQYLKKIIQKDLPNHPRHLLWKKKGKSASDQLKKLPDRKQESKNNILSNV